MTDDFDLDRLAEIPDPFAGSARSPERRVSPAQMARSPGRTRRRTLRVVAAAGALLCDAAWVALVERRPDLASVPSSRLAFGLAIPLAAGALALSAITRRGQIGLGETKARVVTLAIASPALFAAATVLVTPAEPPDALFWRHAAGCIVVTALLVVGPLTLGVLAFRRAFAMASVWRTAALGVASGALAAATMTLVCPIGSASHIILGHGTMMVIAGAIGAMLGRRACRA
jgi:hypothetical protein